MLPRIQCANALVAGFWFVALVATILQGIVASAQQDAMYGEKVLTIGEGTLLHPISRLENHPWFEVSKLRPGRNLSDALELDFAFEGNVTGPIHIVAITSGEKHRFLISPQELAKRQATFICSFNAIADKSPFGADVEVYVEFTDADPMSTNHMSRNAPSRSNGEPAKPLFFKVSKSTTRGTVEAITLSRTIRPSEKTLYESRLKKYGPPPSPPKGFSIAESSSAIVPGTPVLSSHEGEWMKAEVLAFATDKQLVVHWPELTHSANKILPRTYVAMNEATLEKLKSDPSRFSPSVEVLDGNTQPLPSDYVVVPANLELVPGTPLHRQWGGGFWDLNAVQNGTDMIPVLSDRMGRREEMVPRRQLAIRKQTLDKLKSPMAVKEFAAKLKELQAIIESNDPLSSARSGLSLNDRYPITLALTAGFQRVDETTKLNVGTECVVCWGRSWSKVSIVSIEGKDRVQVKWEGWSSVENLPRTSLAVSEETLKAIGDKKSQPANNDDEKKGGTPSNASKNAKYTLTIEKGSSVSLPVLKIVMKLAEMDVKSAKDVIENAPIELKADLSEQEAEKWARELKAAGAVVRVQKQKP